MRTYEDVQRALASIHHKNGAIIAEADGTVLAHRPPLEGGQTTLFVFEGRSEVRQAPHGPEGDYGAGEPA